MMLVNFRHERAGRMVSRRALLKRTLLMGGLGCLLVACSHGQMQGQMGDALYSIGVNGEGNRITIIPEMNGHESDIVVSVESSRGLGQATIAWWGNSPSSVRFQLPLRGLEQFTLRWAEAQAKFVTVTVNVNSSDQHVSQSVQRDGETAQILAADSPYWMEVSLPAAGIDADGDTQTVAYQLAVPSMFVMNKPRLWAISWVDFFR